MTAVKTPCPNSASRVASLLLWCLVCIVISGTKALGSMTLLSGLPSLDKAELRGESPITLELKNRIICGNDPVNRHDPLGLLDARLGLTGTSAATSAVADGAAIANSVSSAVLGGATAGAVGLTIGIAAPPLAYHHLQRANNMFQYGTPLGRPSAFGRIGVAGSGRRNQERNGGGLIPYTGPLYDGEYRDHEGNVLTADGEIAVEKTGTRRISEVQRRSRASERFSNFRNFPSKIGGTGAAYDELGGQGLYVLRNPKMGNRIEYVGRGDAVRRLRDHALPGSGNEDLVGEILWNNNLPMAHAMSLERELTHLLGGPRSLRPDSILRNKIEPFSVDHPAFLGLEFSAGDDLLTETLKRGGLAK